MGYRITEATVEVCNGRTCWKERRYMAQKQHSILWGAVTWWFPCINAEWRSTEAEAGRDIQCDWVLRQPARSGGVIPDPDDPGP